MERSTIPSPTGYHSPAETVKWLRQPERLVHMDLCVGSGHVPACFGLPGTRSSSELSR